MKKENNENLISKINFSTNHDQLWKNLFIETYKQSCCNIKEMNESLKIYEQKLEPIKDLNNNVINEFINQLKSREFTIENIQEAINKTKAITNTSGKELFMTIRKATTNLEHGPELSKTIFLFGKEKIYYRLGIKNEN